MTCRRKVRHLFCLTSNATAFRVRGLGGCGALGPVRERALRKAPLFSGYRYRGALCGTPGSAYPQL